MVEQGRNLRTNALTILGGRVLVEGRFEEAVVRVEAGRIAEIAGSEGRAADGRGRLLHYEAVAGSLFL